MVSLTNEAVSGVESGCSCDDFHLPPNQEWQTPDCLISFIIWSYRISLSGRGQQTFFVREKSMTPESGLWIVEQNVEEGGSSWLRNIVAMLPLRFR